MGATEDRTPRAARSGGWLWLALLALVAALLLSVACGKFPLDVGQIVASLFARLTGSASPLPETAEAVIWNVRLPRVVAGVIVGAALGVAGAAFQGMFRNPLVSPDILGVSAGCGLGASLAILVGASVGTVAAVAFAGGLVAVSLVTWVAAGAREHEPVLVMVLAGVAVSALLGAGISMVKLLADPTVQLPAITFWLLGGLNAVTWADLRYAAPIALVALLPMWLWRWRINLLTLPDDEAAALGTHVAQLRLLVVTAATLMTAAAVAMSGIVGWVGLVVPHVARLVVGPEFGRLLPMSLLCGAVFVVLADTLARTVAPIELPLSVLTSMVGVPVFLWLLGRRRQPG